MFILKHNIKIRKCYNNYQLIKKHNIDNINNFINYCNMIKKTISSKKFKPFILYDIKRMLKTYNYVVISKRDDIQHIINYSIIDTSIPIYKITDNDLYRSKKSYNEPKKFQKYYITKDNMETKWFDPIEYIENIKKCRYLETNISYVNISVSKNILDICKNNGIFLEIGHVLFFISDNKKIIAKLKLIM
ncbi:MAG: hypothetical protein [Caudoviricetes sp.]|nr:MAG: hypothetical protein [Caudoviricetes sp.]